jgi:hypothetical protein
VLLAGVIGNFNRWSPVMQVKPLIFLSCAALFLSTTGVSLAGPCNMASTKDAGSGPTRGAAAQSTTGSATATARSGEHPPTSTMNQASSNTAASSEDAQRQMQGQPTAAQEAQGAKAKTGKNDC